MADRLLVDVSADGRVSVSAQLDGSLPDAPVGPAVDLASPLDAAALDDLRWYLEDYLVVPFGVYGDRGEKVANQLSTWGTALFDAVFGTGPARDLYKELRARTGPTELIVRSPSPAALGLPWELLRDPARPTPLALDLAGMSRSLPGSGLPAPFQASGDRLRVLMVIARPRGADDVGYQMVARPLLRRLDAVRGQVELVVLRPPTIEAFEQVLRSASEDERPFQVVHFDGHGVLRGRRSGGGASGSPHMYTQPAGEGLLQFEPSSGSADDDGLVTAARFAAVLKDARVPLVVLNACQSAAMGDQVEAAVATRLLQEGTAAMVAMGYSVYAVAAAEFMAAFYERLFAGDGVTAAVAAGRRRLSDRPLRPSPKGRLPLSDWMVPVHYLRREVRFPELVREPVADGELSLGDQLDRIRTGAADDRDGLAAAGEFVGRDAELYELERLARDRRVVVVHGPGGSGKTELAKAFGRWWRATGGVGRPEWVVWHSFEPGVATFGLDGALSAIGLQLFGPDFARAGPDERRAVVVDALRQYRTLVLWDNVETIRTMPDPTGATPPLGPEECDELRDFLAEVAAPGGKSSVLLTSRAPETWLGEVGRLGVGGLAAGDRAEYAEQLIGNDPAARTRRDDRAFGELLEWLAGHPLSMRLVLPHLATTDAASLLAGLQGTEPLPVDADRQESRTTSLAASITYSFDHLDERERSLLTAVSLFHGIADADVLAMFSEVDDIPDRFKGVDRDGWGALLDHATELGLLTAIGMGMYEIHPALPAFLTALWRTEHSDDHADERSGSTDALLTAYGQLCKWLRQQIETGDAAVAFAVLDRQRRTLGRLLSYALMTHRWDSAQALAQALNRYWDARGLRAEADSWADHLRSAVETPTGAPPPLNEPAGVLWLFVVSSEANRALEAGELVRAQQACTKLLELLELQPTHPDQQRHIAVIAHQLGGIAQDRGQLDDAENWCHKSLTIEEELGNRPDQASTYHQLGTIAQLRGHLDDAENWYHQSLTIKEELNDRPGLARAYHQLGMIAQDRGHLDDAKNWYHQSLTIKEELGNRPGLAVTYGQLGRLAERHGEPREALERTVQCVALFDEFPHPLTAPGPWHLVRLTGQLGMAVLEEVWREVTGEGLPEQVRRYVEDALEQAEGEGGNDR